MNTETIISKTEHSLHADYEGGHWLLLQYLLTAQSQFSHIPASIITDLSSQLHISEADIHGVISFYSFLHTNPRGSYNIYVSDNITDRMQGNADVLQTLNETLAFDTEASISTTSCIGMSDQGPAILVNGQPIPSLDGNKTRTVCDLVNKRVPLDQWPDNFFEVNDNIHRRDLLLSTEFKNGKALHNLIEKDADTVLNELEQSGLRGRGGAGFNTASKWRFSRQAIADQHYVICNADEGEPGTFKDRVLLNSFAHSVFEGMTLCAGIINSTQGFLYLRAEYHHLLPKLQKVLQQRREQRLLGRNILGKKGFDFDIDIHLGAGAYICGEESALIESLEGKRGVPRNRPPFPVTNGYRDKPSVVNNVETFMAAARIAEHDAGWFRQSGTKESTGTKLISVSGDCSQPGVYEYPFGISIQQILQDCGATDTQVVQIAGAAGNLFTPQEFNRTISFEDIATAGSFMILNNTRDLLEMVKNFSEFFVHESCGFCTPCRVGTSLQRDLVTKLANGHATPYDLNELKNIGNLMKNSSHCGLGATAPNAVLDLINKLPELINRKLAHTEYEPAFDLDAALQEARDITGRDDEGAHIQSGPGADR